MGIGRARNLAGGRQARASGPARGDEEGVTAIAVPALIAPAAVVARVRTSIAVVALLLCPRSGCLDLPRPQSEASRSGRRFTTTALLHGGWFDLHLSAPRTLAAPAVLVLYASGAGGWFGTAVDDNVPGVVAVGLAEGEDLNVSGPEDETDDGIAGPEKRRWPFETYAPIPRVGPRPFAVIQATGDGYLPAARARALSGPDTPLRRFHAFEAKDHRLSGGGAAFTAAWLGAIRWIASPA